MSRGEICVLNRSKLYGIYNKKEEKSGGSYGGIGRIRREKGRV